LEPIRPHLPLHHDREQSSYNPLMCGRYTIRRVDIFIRHGAMDPPPFEEIDEKRIVPRFNVAPSQQVPVIRLNGDDARRLGFVKWGLIPSWTRGKPKTIPKYARAETVAESNMYKAALERRRCLVLADGFYEWHKIDEKTKQPYFVRLKTDEAFAFAGLWERWKADDASQPVDTMALITTVPNMLMAPIHDRMPVILPSSEHDRWLNRSVSGRDVLDLLAPYDADLMEAWPVSTRVNSPRNDDERLIDPTDEQP
jgi:putative SOS response-associated peptidase YedK